MNAEATTVSTLTRELPKSQGLTSKLVGSILMIIGTSIGGGMLALPVATAQSGFMTASIMLIVCWLFMTVSALLILEVNMWLSPGTNLVSMANATLGKPGKFIAWTANLLLMYSLLCAYISGGADIFGEILSLVHIPRLPYLDAVLFTALLGIVVFRGIRSVDYVNRSLMSGKFALYLLLVFSIAPHVNFSFLQSSRPHYLLSMVMIMITSFGFANIIPSLRVYLNNNVALLRKAILLGSLVPLLVYILWIFVVLGTIPLDGANGLLNMGQSGHSNSDLMVAISTYLQNGWVTSFAHSFTAICMGTSFLGVSLALNDFLADGLHVVKQGRGKWFITALTFGPPLLLLFFYPGLFLAGLRFAGICCVVLLALLPALMAWQGRYRSGIAHGYRVAGGKISLAIIALSASAIILLDILHIG